MKAIKESLQDWNNEAAVKIAAATSNARKAQSSSNFWTAVAMVANSVNAGLNSSVGNDALANAAAFDNQMLARQVAADFAQGQLMVNQIMQSAQQAAPQIDQALAGLEGLSGRMVQRTMKDVRVSLGEVNAKAGVLSRQHEYEADQMAVAYLANAAIDPKGCLDMVALLHRGHDRPVAQGTDSHPGEMERKAKIEAAIAAYESNDRTAVARPTPNPALAYRYDDRQQLVTVYPRSLVPASASAPFTVDRFLSDPDAAKRDRPSRRTTPAPAPRQPQGAAVQAGQRSTGQNLSDNQDWQQQKEAAAKRYAEMQEWMRNRVR
jgi:hypothetical protein